MRGRGQGAQICRIMSAHLYGRLAYLKTELGQVVEEFGKREGVSDQRSTDAVSNPNRHRQAGRIVRDGLNQASPFTLGKAERRPTRDRGVHYVRDDELFADNAAGALL